MAVTIPTALLLVASSGEDPVPLSTYTLLSLTGLERTLPFCSMPKVTSKLPEVGGSMVTVKTIDSPGFGELALSLATGLSSTTWTAAA